MFRIGNDLIELKGPRIDHGCTAEVAHPPFPAGWPVGFDLQAKLEGNGN